MVVFFFDPLARAPLSTLSRTPLSPPPAQLRYLSWDDYFMALAFLSAQRSKDPSKQVRGRERAREGKTSGGAGRSGAPPPPLSCFPSCTLTATLSLAPSPLPSP